MIVRTPRRSILLVAAAALLVLPFEADAIPAFARKYKVSCALCHAPFPRLNAFGETFAGNGFRLAVGEPAPDTVWAGDALLRLQSALPLAVRVDAYMAALAEDGDVVASDLQTPFGLKLLSGGQITDDISYYLYFYMSERGEVAGLEDAFVQVTDVAGTGVNLIVGQFQVSDPLFKRELRLPYEDYALYRMRLGDARADFTYDRGIMATYSPREGTDLTVEVVNGRGLDEASGSTRRYDEDQWKNLLGRVSQDLGLVRVGGVVYVGQERAEGVADDILYWGVDGTLPLGSRTEVSFQYLKRTDENPFFLEECAGDDLRCDSDAADPFEASAEGVMAEVLFFPSGAMGRWGLFGLYNRVWADRPVFNVRLGESLGTEAGLTNSGGRPLVEEWETVAGGATYQVARNFRLVGEVMYDMTQEQSRLTLGLVTAF
ncbi:MAG: hypothetical protein JSU98_17075 [Gemmatimonadales bacterium]|jgi:hypothetical protein|nr:MAG: hypothetical protein JSU98_17075 [Gemmatimonadales bacterium]